MTSVRSRMVGDMITLVIAVLCGAGVGAALGCTGTAGWGWSSFFGVLAFGTVQGVSGWILQKKVKAAMMAVQNVLTEGQKRLQAKVARWQMRPPGSIQAAQAEMARDQAVFVKEALALTEPLHRFDRWVPMMKRQIATAQFQLHWMLKDFAKVDELMPLALFLDPVSNAMRMARLQMTNAPLERIEKVYRKAVARARYNQNVLPAATWSWILLKRGDADAAFRTLNAALEKSDNEVLKANREHLANNRLAHFNNAGLGDQWYALLLEEPKIRQQRQHMQWR